MRLSKILTLRSALMKDERRIWLRAARFEVQRTYVKTETGGDYS
jgi:hypothetical protein